MNINARKLLLFLAIKFEGNYEKIISAVRAKEKLTSEELVEYEKIEAGDYITILDDDYPEKFKNIYRPPLILFYKGNKQLLSNSNKIIGIVGTRQPSAYGLKVTKEIAQGLSQSGYTIVSGLAKGIDATAHQATLDVNGDTIAVLGCGINTVYPSSNKKLYDAIIENGLVISEYPLNTEPKKDNFPERNRIVAGLVNSVVVTEAKYRSGTMITVGFVLANGGEVFCVPQRAGEESGTNKLIRDGATLVENSKDIINHLNNL